MNRIKSRRERQEIAATKATRRYMQSSGFEFGMPPTTTGSMLPNLEPPFKTSRFDRTQ